MIDPRTPVIVGVAQSNEREADCEPIAAMTHVVVEALARTGAKDALRSQVGSVRVLQGIWPYRDPGRLVADACGFGAVQTTLSPAGGNEAYDLVNVTAGDIQVGRLDVAVLCSAEVVRTSRRLRARGESAELVSEPDDAAPDHIYNEGAHQYDPDQIRVGAVLPVAFYAMAETALRHARGESIDAHRTRVADLWAQASEVAATNPYASLPRVVSGIDIATASPSNRMVAAPYTKLMTANINVDMAAAVVMCSFGAARAAGIDEDELVFVVGGTAASDPWEVTKRWAIHESPAMRIAGRRALELAGITIDEFDDIDVYSCFPSAVQLAQGYLELDVDRPYTITGGLTFAGGPLNSYCMHALATACDRIRERRASRTLLTGNGGFFTMHACTVLSSEPPPAGFQWDCPQNEVDAGPFRELPTARPPTAVLESYTVTYDREGQRETAIVTALDDAGCRHWATSRTDEVIDALLARDCIGATVYFGGVDAARPEIVKID